MGSRAVQNVNIRVRFERPADVPREKRAVEASESAQLADTLSLSLFLLVRSRTTVIRGTQRIPRESAALRLGSRSALTRPRKLLHDETRPQSGFARARGGRGRGTLRPLPPTSLLPRPVLRPALVTSLLYVTAFALVLVGALVVALVGEKAYRRFWLGQVPPSPSTDAGTAQANRRVGDAAPDEGPDALRRARRFTREARMDAVAERVIESFEQTSIGRELVRRRNKRNAASSSSRRHLGQERGRDQVGGEAYELSDIGTSRSVSARTTARRRTPPPLPAR